MHRRPLEHHAQQQQLCDTQWQSLDLAAQPGEVKLEPSEEVKRQGRLRRPSHRLKDDQGLNRAGRGKSSKGRVPVIKQEAPDFGDASDSSSKGDDGSSSDDGNGATQGKPRRVMANRQAAQRSRMRKLQHISDLEGSLQKLQAEVQHLIPQVRSARTKEAGLTTKNAELHEQLGALMEEVQYKDAVNNVLAQDIVRLQQQQQSSQAAQQQLEKRLTEQPQLSRSPAEVGPTADLPLETDLPRERLLLRRRPPPSSLSSITRTYAESKGFSNLGTGKDGAAQRNKQRLGRLLSRTPWGTSRAALVH
eukprot:jgi/Astpho2/9278/Aster-x1566